MMFLQADCGANNFPLESCKREKTFYMILRESYSPRQSELTSLRGVQRELLAAKQAAERDGRFRPVRGQRAEAGSGAPGEHDAQD